MGMIKYNGREVQMSSENIDYQAVIDQLQAENEDLRIALSKYRLSFLYDVTWYTMLRFIQNVHFVVGLLAGLLIAAITSLFREVKH